MLGSFLHTLRKTNLQKIQFKNIETFTDFWSVFWNLKRVYKRIKFPITKYSTLQYSTVQYGTIQYSSE